MERCRREPWRRDHHRKTAGVVEGEGDGRMQICRVKCGLRSLSAMHDGDMGVAGGTHSSSVRVPIGRIHAIDALMRPEIRAHPFSDKLDHPHQLRLPATTYER
ncbi:hypothetical protein NECAME_00097 [Necator americanus]|uniref:Uncharacterized protein n=1 Tax=Necator americanus TaxID=51031 RepID=W2TZG2_NECAM|nr:hypothetical protein NECAME_00097 [Necator americanus]ETN87238.1 hypothetical protein NECAME_00097 [Necator americanus]